MEKMILTINEFKWKNDLSSLMMDLFITQIRAILSSVSWSFSLSLKSTPAFRLHFNMKYSEIQHMK